MRPQRAERIHSQHSLSTLPLSLGSRKRQSSGLHSQDLGWGSLSGVPTWPSRPKTWIGILEHPNLESLNNRHFFLIMLEARILRSRWQYGWFLVKPLFLVCRCVLIRPLVCIYIEIILMFSPPLIRTPVLLDPYDLF